jgi:excisionase family DNA binding protein
MSALGERVSLAGGTLASMVTGAILLAVGSVLRQPQTVAAGKRQFHSHARERRWIPDDDERELHAAVVAERLGISAVPRPEQVRVTEAARRLGVSASTVRRRVQRGELEAVFQNGRMTGIVLEAD